MCCGMWRQVGLAGGFGVVLCGGLGGGESNLAGMLCIFLTGTETFLSRRGRLSGVSCGAPGEFSRAVVHPGRRHCETGLCCTCCVTRDRCVGCTVPGYCLLYPLLDPPYLLRLARSYPYNLSTGELLEVGGHDT